MCYYNNWSAVTCPGRAEKKESCQKEKVVPKKKSRAKKKRLYRKKKSCRKEKVVPKKIGVPKNKSRTREN